MTQEPEQAKISYFKEEELSQMSSKFLSFQELIFFSLKLFKRAWWKAFLAPILWSLLYCIIFVVAIIVLAYITGFSASMFAGSTPIISILFGLLSFVFTFLGIVAYIIFLVQILVRNIVLLDDATATFRKPKIQIWNIFRRLFGLGFVLGFIYIGTSIISTIFQSGASLTPDTTSVVITVAIYVFSGWILNLLYPFTALITFKNYNVRESLYGGLLIIQKSFSDLLYRNLFLALALSVPSVLVLYLNYTFVIDIISPNSTKSILEKVVMILLLLIIGVAVLIVSKFISYTSFTNIYLLNNTKESKDLKLDSKQNNKLNLIMAGFVILSIISFAVYMSIYINLVQKNMEMLRDQSTPGSVLTGQK